MGTGGHKKKAMTQMRHAYIQAAFQSIGHIRSFDGFAVGPFRVLTPSAGLFRFARGTYFFFNLATASDVVLANAILWG